MAVPTKKLPTPPQKPSQPAPPMKPSSLSLNSQGNKTTKSSGLTFGELSIDNEKKQTSSSKRNPSLPLQKDFESGFHNNDGQQKPKRLPPLPPK